MPSQSKTIFIATRGSALALAQSNQVLAQCRQAFPEWSFELKIIKTTGDKLQTASMAQEGGALPKGLFTKELEVALLNGQADLAVHSLKDLPTDLPEGLELGAVGKRADVRDVLLYREPPQPEAGSGTGATSGRGFPAGLSLADLPSQAVVATSSTRRRAQLLAAHPTLRTPDIRGNVATRLHKLKENAALDATLLAIAGLGRLGFGIDAAGRLSGAGLPAGLLASILPLEVMLPCVGQGAIGIEVRQNDEPIARLCAALNHLPTLECVTAERSFLSAMGGGCQSPVAAYAEIDGESIRMKAVSFAAGPVARAEASRPRGQAAELGRQIAHSLKP
jgi:hydroxymethylbilane synthase